MFKELAPIAKSTMINLFISGEGDLLRVLVMPKAIEGQDPALFTPLSLVGTPDELDEKLPEILNGYASSRQSLEDTLENVKLVMDEAKKAAQGKAAAKPAGGKTVTTKPVVAATNAHDDEGGLGDDVPFEADSAVSAVSTKKAVNSDDASILFG